jgi:hypothetical protein
VIFARARGSLVTWTKRNSGKRLFSVTQSNEPLLSKATTGNAPRVREGIAPGIGGSLALLLFNVERYEEPHQPKQPLIARLRRKPPEHHELHYDNNYE